MVAEAEEVEDADLDTEGEALLVLEPIPVAETDADRVELLDESELRDADDVLEPDEDAVD
jgi:hypothetical protein